MILVDTSVWIRHFRGTTSSLSAVLQDGLVLIHPYIIGEMACGSLPDRTNTLDLLAGLPRAPTASHSETLLVIEQYQLMNQGVGYVDVALLASALLGGDVLWSDDQPLTRAADQLGLKFAP